MSTYTRSLLGNEFTVSSGSISRGSLFNQDTRFWAIDPTIHGPNANIGSFSAFSTSSDVVLPNAANFADSAWTAAGWNLSSLEKQLEAFINRHATVLSPVNDRAYNCYISKFNNAGTNYTVAIFHEGNKGTSTIPTSYSVSVVGNINDGSGTGNTQVFAPTDVALPAGFRAKQAEAHTITSYSRVIMLGEDGTVWTWGQGLAVGDGTTTDKNVPVPILHPSQGKFVKIGAGNQASYALDSAGNLMSWGGAVNGGLGAGNFDAVSSPVQVLGNSFVDFVGNNTFTLALKSNGQVWGWGTNNFGQLGNNAIATNTSSPVQVVGNHSFVKVFLSQNNNNNIAAALKADGSAWMWGSNTAGQLGDGTITNRSSPVQVLGGHSFTRLVSQISIAAGIKADGTIWAWGSGGSGGLGNNTSGSVSSPVQVIGNHSFIQLAECGQGFAALKADGTIWGWGTGNSGQLGNNNNVNISSPVQVVGNHSFSEILGPYTDFCFFARKSVGEVWAWGANSSGYLGDGTLISRSSPVLVLNGDFRAAFVRGVGGVLMRSAKE